MSISTPFIRRPVATSLLMAAFILVGIAAYPFLPVAPLPRVDFPTINVTGKFPGASPETMAATVAQPLEYQFAQIPGVAQMTSVSVLGSTQVTIQFDLDRNIDGAAGDVQAAINAAGGQLPKNLPSPPTYRKVNPADSPILILSLSSDAMPMINVDDYADNILSQQISQVSGVSQVVIGGEQKRAVRVQLDPAKLANMGMTLEDVRNTLVNATVNAPKGSIDNDTRSLTVYDNDQLTRAAEYDNVILAYRNGAAVRVRDVGRAYYEKNESRYSAPERIQIWRILCTTREDAQRVLEAAERDPTPRAFSELAREHSLDRATYLRGGNVGFILPDGGSNEPGLHIDPAVVRAAQSVRDGEIVPAPVVEGAYYAVVWRRGTQQATRKTVEEAAVSIREVLWREHFKIADRPLVMALRKAWSAMSTRRCSLASIPRQRQANARRPRRTRSQRRRRTPQTATDGGARRGWPALPCYPCRRRWSGPGSKSKAARFRRA